mmetsp:Transcript_3639/g.5443  ORF Transcript_3639/g.5443 Transcript_3639/m.5443 type:complete len:201 (-) Transcript_3639:2016-2618(-)
MGEELSGRIGLRVGGDVVCSVLSPQRRHGLDSQQFGRLFSRKRRPDPGDGSPFPQQRPRLGVGDARVACRPRTRDPGTRLRRTRGPVRRQRRPQPPRNRAGGRRPWNRRSAPVPLGRQWTAGHRVWIPVPGDGFSGSVRGPGKLRDSPRSRAERPPGRLWRDAVGDVRVGPAAAAGDGRQLSDFESVPGGDTARLLFWRR